MCKGKIKVSGLIRIRHSQFNVPHGAKSKKPLTLSTHNVSYTLIHNYNHICGYCYTFQTQLYITYTNSLFFHITNSLCVSVSSFRRLSYYKLPVL